MKEKKKKSSTLNRQISGSVFASSGPTGL